MISTGIFNQHDAEYWRYQSLKLSLEVMLNRNDQLMTEEEANNFLDFAKPKLNEIYNISQIGSLIKEWSFGNIINLTAFFQGNPEVKVQLINNLQQKKFLNELETFLNKNADNHMMGLNIEYHGKISDGQFNKILNKVVLYKELQGVSFDIKHSSEMTINSLDKLEKIFRKLPKLEYVNLDFGKSKFTEGEIVKFEKLCSLAKCRVATRFRGSKVSGLKFDRVRENYWSLRKLIPPVIDEYSFENTIPTDDQLSMIETKLKSNRTLLVDIGKSKDKLIEEIDFPLYKYLENITVLFSTDTYINNWPLPIITAPNLKHLRLEISKSIKENSIHKIYIGLQDLTSLTHLTIHSLDKKNTTDDTLETLLKGTQNMKSLNFLWLDFNECTYISDKGVDYICPIIQRLTSPHFLYLNFNRSHLTDVGLGRLAAIIATHSTLRACYLHFEHTKITDVGLGALAVGYQLQKNLRMLSLRISSCSLIKDYGAKTLFNSLETLNDLDLVHVDFTKCGTSDDIIILMKLFKERNQTIECQFVDRYGNLL